MSQLGSHTPTVRRVSCAFALERFRFQVEETPARKLQVLVRHVKAGMSQLGGHTPTVRRVSCAKRLDCLPLEEVEATSVKSKQERNALKVED